MREDTSHCEALGVGSQVAIHLGSAGGSGTPSSGAAGSGGAAPDDGAARGQGEESGGRGTEPQAASIPTMAVNQRTRDMLLILLEALLALLLLEKLLLLLLKF